MGTHRVDEFNVEGNSYETKIPVNWERCAPVSGFVGFCAIVSNLNTGMKNKQVILKLDESTYESYKGNEVQLEGELIEELRKTIFDTKDHDLTNINEIIYCP